MSKFCQNCGSLMNDADMVCNNCGTVYQEYTEPAVPAAPQQEYNYAPAQGNAPYAEYGVPVQGAGMAPGVPAKQNNFMKQYLPVIIGGAAALIIMIIIICVAASGGYKKTIKNYITALFTADSEAIADNISIIMTDGDDPDPDDYDYAVNFMTELFEDEYGELKSVKIKVNDVDKYKKDEIEEFVEDYCSDDVDASDIKKLYEVNVELQLKGDEKDTDEDDLDDVTFYVSKEKGGWKIARVENLIDY